ncbi:MAG TPA: hypothetical protein VEK15_21480, partial [Vicinamibacteria bacterium]|nr:hypothetical protein [Vicinamibacteria bacterium]
MPARSEASVGFSIHTGWAAAVVVEGPLRAPRIVDRARPPRGFGRYGRGTGLPTGRRDGERCRLKLVHEATRAAARRAAQAKGQG